jgi:small subunit ribosomal protein S20
VPNKQSAAKALRQSHTKHQQNLRLSSELSTLTRKFERLVRDKQIPEATIQLKLLLKRLDQAKVKGVIHQNTVSRKKSRLSSRLAKLSA